MPSSPPAQRQQIENMFTYHSPKGDQATRYSEIRCAALNLAMFVDDRIPASREKSLFLAKLQEAVMFANAAIALNE